MNYDFHLLMRTLIPISVMLAACGTPAEPLVPTPITSSCPACPASNCPPTSCPTAPCPVCPVPEKPPTDDWHCMNVKRSDGFVSGYCWPTADICRDRRQYAIQTKIGQVSACTTQPTSYCLQVVHSRELWRQVWCSPTSDGCDLRRKRMLAQRQAKDDELTRCVHTLNTDPFTLEAAEGMFEPPQ